MNRTVVLVDASQLSGESANSGIGTYVRCLLDGLVDDDELIVSASATTDAILPSGIRRETIRRLARQGRPAVWEHELRRSYELLRSRADVFHNPNPHAPAICRGRWVQTLHDVIPLVYPDPVLEAVRRRWQRFGPRYQKADRVISVSRHAADAGMQYLGLRADRIEVVHHGVGPEFTPGCGHPRDDPPYLSVVSEYSARKGLGEALAVIGGLAEAGYPHDLKFAGKVPPWVRADFDRLVLAADHRERLDMLGFVKDLPALYRGATLHLITSRYEGFGLPALEAMACGTPVVAFANSSIPEIVGDGGILVPDGDVAAMISAVRSVLDDPALRAELRERALARASHFSWEESARRHSEIYRAAST